MCTFYTSKPLAKFQESKNNGKKPSMTQNPNEIIQRIKEH